jgi:hypothetical protein
MFTCEEQLEIGALRYQQISCLAAAVISSRRGRILKYKKRSVWIREWILDRPLFGQYENLMSELCRADIKGVQELYKSGLCYVRRVSPQSIGPRIERQDTFFRKALDPGLYVEVTRHIYHPVCSRKHHVHTWCLRDCTRLQKDCQKQQNDTLVSQRIFKHFENFTTTELDLRLLPIVYETLRFN